jgi:hypothetical protein
MVSPFGNRPHWMQHLRGELYRNHVRVCSLKFNPLTLGSRTEWGGKIVDNPYLLFSLQYLSDCGGWQAQLSAVVGKGEPPSLARGSQPALFEAGSADGDIRGAPPPRRHPATGIKRVKGSIGGIQGGSRSLFSQYFFGFPPAPGPMPFPIPGIAGISILV